MKIYFHGATGGVTGSAYHVTTKHASVLVDCGLFQGSKEERAKNRHRAKLEGGRLDAVVLTHAHLDHVGRLPLLTKHGYQGPIYATQATIDVATLILRDAFYLQQADLERENRKRARSGLAPLEPLYEEKDVRGLRPLVRAVAYDQIIKVAPGIHARLVDAGHVIGSASVELTVEEDGRKKVIIFSGDLGARGAPLLNDPVPFERADAVIMESTYGDRNHRSLRETAIEARHIVEKAIEARAKILVPVFAVGRTQLLLYLLAAAFRNKTLPRFPIYVDSPLAIEATKVYGRHNELFDEEAQAMVKSGELRRQLQSVRFCPTADESRELNNKKGPCMIMAGNGMCTGGRIVHHLRHNLYRPETAILIVGFQSPGTLGRQLVDGKKSVTILGEECVVRASIHTMGGLSAHAGQHDLLNWFAVVAPSRPRAIITHGENPARKALSDLIRSRHGLRPECPNLGDVIEI
ncbi:MAG: MBL fold metallo-hydrolase [bacterium]|uniref:MBL fold metallo-hydrolase n=1 Tax=Candidatus Methylomirabilis tolerans TaxID=3123416 RepID=A0AAJ1EIW4_9BACT|nr:MBL fold metallo-hydrolase [Candidatus Methylomirabilis sp.]